MFFFSFIVFVAETSTDLRLLKNGYYTSLTFLSLHSWPLSNGGVLFLLKALVSNAFLAVIIFFNGI